MQPLEEKWRGFGWEAFITDGNDAAELLKTFAAVTALNGKPKVVLARTVPLRNRAAVVVRRAYGDDVPEVVAAPCRMCPQEVTDPRRERPVVDEAVCRQIAAGTVYSINHELEVELAEELVDLIPCAEMVRYAVGYQSRAIVTFGSPIPLEGYNAESRRDVMDLAHLTRDTIGRLIKVLPTAVIAAAMRPSMTRNDLEARADAIIDTARRAGGNLGVQSGREAVEEGTAPLVARNIIYVERDGRFRVRERTVLRYYSRTLQHLLTGSRRVHVPRTH